MPSPCSVCLRSNRAEIDDRLARERVNLTALAHSYGVGRKALERHREHHIPSQLAHVRAAIDSESPSPLLEELERLYDLTLRALAAAESATLSHIDSANRSQPTASHATIARFIDDARQHVGSLTELFLHTARTRQLASTLAPPLDARMTAALAQILDRARRQLEAEEA